MFDLSKVGTLVLEGKVPSLPVVVLPSERSTGFVDMYFAQVQSSHHLKQILILKGTVIILVMRLKGTVKECNMSSQKYTDCE
jgi:hypothetical protein